MKTRVKGNARETRAKRVKPTSTPRAGAKKVKPISIGKPLARGFRDFFNHYVIEKELRNGLVVRKKKTGELLKVYGDERNRTVVEPYMGKV